MKIPVVQPPRLKPGDTIAVVAPASPISSREIFDRGIAAIESMGFRVRIDNRIFQSSRYLAGTDQDRAEEFMSNLEDPSIQAILALRGGYGCARLIPYLDENRLRPHPKILMGFSDLTTLFLFLNKKFGWTTFHGPMAATSTLSEFSPDQSQHLFSLWTDPGYRPAFAFPQLEAWSPGIAEGILVGGCLSVIVTSLGTPYEIETEGKILFLEDTGEPPYRLDRMITHLALAGKLKSLSGLLLGSFQDCEPTQSQYTAAEVLRDLLTYLKVPILSNFPAGHIKDNWTLPLGTRIRIDANAKSIRFLDSAVR
jgi:muramoyltetrapeptide carboxypeptidase